MTVVPITQAADQLDAVFFALSDPVRRAILQRLDGEALLVALDLAGIACSLGSTCASGSTEPAPSLVAMGLPRDRLHSSVRFSVGIDNTADEIRLAIDKIAGVVQRLRSQSA